MHQVLAVVSNNHFKFANRRKPTSLLSNDYCLSIVSVFGTVDLTDDTSTTAETTISTKRAKLGHRREQHETSSVRLVNFCSCTLVGSGMSQHARQVLQCTQRQLDVEMSLHQVARQELVLVQEKHEHVKQYDAKDVQEVWRKQSGQEACGRQCSSGAAGAARDRTRCALLFIT